MPLPQKKKGQNREEFVSSCMSNETMKSEFPGQKQRLAVCYSQWKKKSKKKSKGEVIEFDENDVKIGDILLP